MTRKSLSRDIARQNKKSLDQLIRTIRLSEGRFLLILAHCNFEGLRNQVLEQLRSSSPVKIREIYLAGEIETLSMSVEAGSGKEFPYAVMVSGLENVGNIENVLYAANQNREKFRRHVNFSFPLILWVNDDILDKFNRFAQEFRYWAGLPFNFKLANIDIVSALQENADNLFNEILEPDIYKAIHKAKKMPVANLLKENEIEYFLKELKYRRLDLEAGSEADLNFLKGKNEQNKAHADLALDYYNSSLLFWKECGSREKEGALLSLIADCYEQKSNLDRARFCLQASIDSFSQDHSLVPKLMRSQCNILRKSEKFDELDNFSNQLQMLNKKCNNMPERARNYSFLAALELYNKQDWKKAAEFAQKALDILCKISPDPDNTSESFPIVRDKARYIIAQAYRYSGQSQKAINSLEIAGFESEPELNPELYINILKLLHILYFEKEQYLNAFCIKQELLLLEQQFGLRAFAGPGPLRTPVYIRSGISPEKTGLEHNIRILGRQTDVNRLIDRIDQRDHRLLVIHGESGVGKSLVLEAGLHPVLKQRIIDKHEVIPVSVRNYDANWIGKIGENLWDALEKRKHTPVWPLNSKERILEELRRNNERNLLTVLIFDQFEEFFFTNPELDKREEFYEFLYECLNISDAQPQNDIINLQGFQNLEGFRQNDIKDSIFDVFLCHNSQNKPLVMEIAAELKKFGISPWLDIWNLQPGLPWQKCLEKEIENIKSAAVFVGENGIGPWQDQEISAFIRQFVNRGCPVIPVILPECRREPELRGFLENMTKVDFREKIPDPMSQLIWGITGSKNLKARLVKDIGISNIPCVKIILSLRKNYLHYLLEFEQSEKLDLINIDILSKNNRYSLENFTPGDAKYIIQSLAKHSDFNMENELIDAVVWDLANESDEIRPVELQIIGSQLQSEEITTLREYELCFKEELFEKFLQDVIHDCGEKNKDATLAILRQLTDEDNNCLVKTRSELASGLKNLNIEVDDRRIQMILEILTRAGVIFLIPEYPVRYQVANDYMVKW